VIKLTSVWPGLALIIRSPRLGDDRLSASRIEELMP
jgi:hypothetical protein